MGVEQIDKQKILLKLEKLLALANSAPHNPKEAAVAAAKLKELMEEYSISRDEIGLINKKVELVEESHVDLKVKKPRKWASRLAACIADFYDCRVISPQSSGIYIFIGFDLDRKVCSKLFLKLYISIISEGWKVLDELGGGSRNMNSFCYGIVSEISRRLKEEKILVSNGNYTTVLVVRKSEEISVFINNKYQKLNDYNLDTSLDYPSYVKGLVVGRKMEIFEKKKVEGD